MLSLLSNCIEVYYYHHHHHLHPLSITVYLFISLYQCPRFSATYYHYMCVCFYSYYSANERGLQSITQKFRRRPQARGVYFFGL